ncbi:MAG TPA: hypothetical protein VF519_09545 [Mycobacteriales bacterium]|jgi:hypothetical protein
MHPEPPEYPVVPLTGVTELRIHGVSGTPVEAMLQDPHPVQVWGDKVAGFYRTAAPDEGTRKEAYSWGRLTAGASARAAWLLLLPFMLVNVAAWAHPTRPQERYTPVGVMSGAVRVLGLCLTALLVIGAALLGMDLIAWQCAGDEARCGDERWFTRWLTDGWASTPGRRIGFGALLPIALVLVMWRLSTSTAKNYEEYDAATGTTEPDPALPKGANDLANRSFWRGGGPLDRLRRLHLAAAFAIVAGLVAYAADDGSAVAATIWKTAAALTALIAALLFSHLTGRRRVLLTGDSANKAFCKAVAAAPAVATALLAAALYYAAFVTDRPAATGPLPGIHGAKHVLFVTMAAMTGVMLAGNVAALFDRDRTFRESVKGPMLNGFLAPFLAYLGLVIGGAYVAGAAIRLADYLGKPVDATCLPDCAGGADVVFGIPREYYWLSRGFGTAAVIGALVGIGVLATRSKAVRKALPDVVTEYAGQTDEKRQRKIAAIHAAAAQTDAGATLLATVVVGATLVTTYSTATTSEGSLANAMTTAGTWLVGAFALGVVAVGRSAYRNERLRRTVGIAWDLGTFWPRSAHPFAPPCYCERTVPELATRIRQLRDAGGTVVVSAHSQGTVIGVAALLQLRENADGICLVTYGSPLHRLYARAFPHFFGLSVLRATDTILGGRWVNLYRRSDPIGGPVLAGDADVPGDDVPPVRPDRRLHDPSFARERYAFTDPPARGHSDYFHDPVFEETVTALAGEVG